MLLLPARVPWRDVGVLAFPARLPVAALGPEVVVAVLARAAAVLVSVAPRVLGYGLLEIRAVPVGHARTPLERVEALACRRVGAGVEPILVEPGAEQFDLGSRRRLLRSEERRVGKSVDLGGRRI